MLCKDCEEKFNRMMKWKMPWSWEHCYHEEEKTIKCPYTKCAHGICVANSGSCYIGGDPQDPLCDKFISEEDWEKERGIL